MNKINFNDCKQVANIFKTLAKANLQEAREIGNFITEKIPADNDFGDYFYFDKNGNHEDIDMAYWQEFFYYMAEILDALSQINND